MRTKDKETENSWRIKAVNRNIEIKRLGKELSRQLLRATTWRRKSLLQGQLICELESKLDKKHELESNRVQVESIRPSKDVVLGCYKYPLSVVWLSIILYKFGLSFRGVCSVLVFVRDFLGINFQIPSYGSVRMWVLKQGLYFLKQGIQGLKKGGDKWVLIVDESYSLGKSSLLLVLAVRINSLKQGQALMLSDVHPIEIRCNESWKSAEIALVLKQAMQKLGGTVEYVTSDRGSNLLGAYKLNELSHVPDWSHYGANILEDCYGKELDFKSFNEKMGTFKKKRKQSIFAAYSPPNLSVKIRFMNYLPFIDWANIMLKNFKEIPSEIIPELQFLNDLNPFIKEMTALFYAVQDIGVLIKLQGICPKTKDKVAIINKKLLNSHPQNLRVTSFIEKIDTYFDLTMPIYAKYMNKNKDSPLLLEALVGSSDIIESIFGKFKHRCLKDPKRGFSSIALIIPLFCRQFSPFEVFRAMCSVSVNDLNNWEKECLGKKGYNTFRNVFKKSKKKGGTFTTAA